MNKALLVIDLQNDYFEGGAYPLWNTEDILDKVEKAIEKANQNQIPVILIQHVSDSSKGKAAFFNEGTKGVKIHKRILQVAGDAKIVKKAYADSFYETDLEQVLTQLGVTEILLCGMMTQNCITHTALSKSAEKYSVKILQDCCTTVDKMIHIIALRGIATRIPLVNYEDVL